MMHQASQGLASLGRNGDSMLVHMSPKEVAGLQGLAMAQGGSLTVNPNTGLPEAFSLGDFFTSLLPTLAGFMVGGPAGGALGLKAGTAGATIAPIAAGMATGAAVAGAKGEDALMGGLMGGLGGFGGGNLASSLGKMGAAAAPGGFTPGAVIPQGTPITTPAGLDALNTAANPFFGSANTMPSLLTDSAGLASNVGAAAPMTYAQSLGQMGSGFGELLKPGGYDKFISPEIGGSGYQLASSFAAPAYEGFKEDLFPAPDTSLEEKRKKEENKYRDPITGQLNLTQASPDFGTMLLAIGGAVNTNPSVGGGLSDLYNRPEGATSQNLSSDGYGMGRLDKLAQQGSYAKAEDMFYADGGPVAFARGGHQGYLDGEGDGMSDSIPATIEGKQPARLADGEFVIPADVVSHIGNGSSKAGSKRLYAMLDRVRKARVGTTKQGKQIKPEKYMPA